MFFLQNGEVAEVMQKLWRQDTVAGLNNYLGVLGDCISLRRRDSLEFPLSTLGSRIPQLSSFRSDFKGLIVRLFFTGVWQIAAPQASGAYLSRLQRVYKGALAVWQARPRIYGQHLPHFLSLCGVLCGVLRSRVLCQGGAGNRRKGYALLRTWHPQWVRFMARPKQHATAEETRCIFDFFVFNVKI